MPTLRADDESVDVDEFAENNGRIGDGGRGDTGDLNDENAAEAASWNGSERDFGVPVASYLSPERDRLKPTRRVRADVADSTSNVAASPLREAPISDDEFIRRLASKQDKKRRRADGNLEPPPVADPAEYRRDATTQEPWDSSKYGRGERKRARTGRIVGCGVAVALALGVVAVWRSTLDVRLDRAARPTVAIAPSEPIFLDGALTYRTPNGRVEGDDGAFVFLFPADSDFGDSLTLGDAAPGRKAPPRFDEFVAKLEERGGYFAVAEFDGRFSISLKKPGVFDVLLVSRNVEDSPDASDAAALKEISRYLYLPEQKLLAKRRFLWKRRKFDEQSAVVEENFGKRRV